MFKYSNPFGRWRQMPSLVFKSIYAYWCMDIKYIVKFVQHMADCSTLLVLDQYDTSLRSNKISQPAGLPFLIMYWSSIDICSSYFQLPRMSHNDAIARYYGLDKGQVVKVTYNGELTQLHVTYRCVWWTGMAILIRYGFSILCSGLLQNLGKFILMCPSVSKFRFFLIVIEIDDICTKAS